MGLSGSVIDHAGKSRVTWISTKLFPGTRIFGYATYQVYWLLLQKTLTNRGSQKGHLTGAPCSPQISFAADSPLCRVQMVIKLKFGVHLYRSQDKWYAPIQATFDKLMVLYAQTKWFWRQGKRFNKPKGRITRFSDKVVSVSVVKVARVS